MPMEILQGTQTPWRKEVELFNPKNKLVDYNLLLANMFPNIITHKANTPNTCKLPDPHPTQKP